MNEKSITSDEFDELSNIFGEPVGDGLLPGTTFNAPAPTGSFKPKLVAAKPAQTSQQDPEKAAAAWLASVGGERYDAGSFAANKPPEIDWVFPGMKAGIVKSLISTGGVGKSFLSLGLAASIASGEDILGLFGKWGRMIFTGRVVFLALEDDRETVHHRIHDIACLEENQSAFSQKLGALDIYGIPGGINLLDPGCDKALSAICKGSRLVIVDTLRMTHDGEENSSGDMKKVMSSLTRLAGETRAAVLFLHHTSKLAAISGEGDNQHASRGSSVITDNSRGSFFLQTMTEDEAQVFRIEERDRKKYIRFGMGKENLGAQWDDIWLRRDHKGIPRAVDLSSQAQYRTVPEPSHVRSNKNTATYKGVEIKI